jgi:hypothetical protein
VRIEVTTRSERRRRWSVEQQRETAAESLLPVLSPITVARRYRISSGLLGHAPPAAPARAPWCRHPRRSGPLMAAWRGKRWWRMWWSANSVILFRSSALPPGADAHAPGHHTGPFDPRLRRGRLWSGPTQPAAYVYSEDRKGEHPTAHLAAFNGIPQVDGGACAWAGLLSDPRAGFSSLVEARKGML